MPGLRPPMTLFQCALPVLTTSIYTSCLHIEEHYGDYSHQQCREKVSALNNYLIHEIPPSILNIIRDLILGQEDTELEDIRIGTSTFIHDRMKTYKIAKHVTADQILLHYYNVTVFPTLTSITYLDVHKMVGICEHSFNVISLNCKELHTFIFTSHLNTEMKNLEQALLYLTRCQRLRMIRDVTSNLISIRNTDCIQTLVRELPNLEVITYYAMNLVLFSPRIVDVGILKLTEIKLTHATLFNIMWLAEHCPDIEEIHFNFIDDKYHDPNIHSCMMQTLAESTLELSSVRFNGVFHFSNGMRSFFKEKGRFIKSLGIVRKSFMSVDFPVFEQHVLNYQNLEFIGTHCPYISKLKLGESFELKEILEPSQEQHCFTDVNTDKMFTCLKDVQIHGNKWNEQKLSLLLGNAKHIDHLTININPAETSNPFLTMVPRLMDFKVLEELTAFHIGGWEFFSPITAPPALSLISMYNRCAKLKILHFYYWKLVSLEDQLTLTAIRNEIEERNLDLLLSIVVIDLLR